MFILNGQIHDIMLIFFLILAGMELLHILGGILCIEAKHIV